MHLQHGLVSVEHLNMIKKLLTKAYKWGLTDKLHCDTSLFSMHDHKLFETMSYSSHCPHHLLPPIHIVSCALRKCGHPYELIEHEFQKSKCSYIVIFVRSILSTCSMCRSTLFVCLCSFLFS